MNNFILLIDGIGVAGCFYAMNRLRDNLTYVAAFNILAFLFLLDIWNRL